MSPSIILIGPRGCGKSTIGRLLAARLHRSFVDLDDVILGMFAQTSVTVVWAEHGESAWRAAELAALSDLLKKPGEPSDPTDAGQSPMVLSLGGGVPTIPAAREVIGAARERGEVWVVYLRCSVATLVQRLSKTPGDRPALTRAATLTDEITQVLTSRAATYQQMADLVLDCDHLSAAATSELIIDACGCENEGRSA